MESGDTIFEDELSTATGAGLLVRSILLFAALVLGVVAGLVLLLPVFRLVPNDLSRTATVIDAIREAPPPAIVVFGDSRAESSVDAAQLTRELPGRPLAYNLAWHAQRLENAFLLYEELPDSVRTVVEVVSLSDLAAPFPNDARIYRAMRAYGCQPSPAALRTLESALGRDAGAAWRTDETGVRWQSRWGVKHVFDSGIRSLVRRDLQLQRERRDLFFPTAYTTRFDAAAVDRSLEKEGTMPPAAIATGKAMLLHAVVLEGRRRGWRLILVLPASHPRFHVPDLGRRVREIAELGRLEGIDVLDLTRALPPEDFVDDVHPTTAGARKLTAVIAEHCRRR